MSLDFGLQGVHVLITGAAGGIGFETVKTFQQLGARVTAHYKSQLGDLDTLDDIPANPAPKSASSSATTGSGPKTTHRSPTWTSPNGRNTLAVNLTGPFLLCRAYLRALRHAPESVKGTANIIFVGSTAGKFGDADHGDYAASKAALQYGLTPTLKNEIVGVAPRGRVNSVNPGWVATPMAEGKLRDRGFVERALATTPLGKVARVEDVARQVAVLASERLSGHVRGVNVMVDGGMEGRLLGPPKTSS
ncbi:NAD(P)-binding protein [Teratosphaeria nubilosa]|uniref:NAD(P)-binding protein n=1 Tax=Teratosphaeria nubilosa TaxID=161662 RepID=A0A6G1LHA1_9PEZI|nr:NAD(P)-binding protein [Teratosphaeria nubilosa]